MLLKACPTSQSWASERSGHMLHPTCCVTRPQIKADADGARSYNYRVVMYSGGAELEMRGRCSAGQKVGCESFGTVLLASLVCTCLLPLFALVPPVAPCCFGSVEVAKGPGSLPLLPFGGCWHNHAIIHHRTNYCVCVVRCWRASSSGSPWLRRSASTAASSPLTSPPPTWTRVRG